MERVKNILIWVRGRLWLVPALMSLAALVLAYGLLVHGGRLSQAWWLYSGSHDTARDLLSTLLSGMITMTSLVVSVTMVVLSLAASQLGPRLIWNFIEDRRIQSVIGLFVATILYILVVLRSIDEPTAAESISHIAVTVASLLSVACLFALLFHVNVLAHSIVADTMVRDVANALDRAVRHLPPEDGARGNDGDGAPGSFPHRRAASLSRSGYVQVIDYDTLCQIAQKHDMVIWMDVRAGHFVLHGAQHFRLGSSAEIADDAVAAIADSVIIGSGRTRTQDLEYAIRQLVEIAVRALSPGINDPFTAIAVIDRLTATLEIVAERSLPAKHHRDKAGRVRVVADASDYGGLVDVAFNQIRQSAAGKPSVLIELARRLTDLLAVVDKPEHKGAVMRHLRMLERAADSIPEPDDRGDLLRVIAAGLQAPRVPAEAEPTST